MSVTQANSVSVCVKVAVKVGKAAILFAFLRRHGGKLARLFLCGNGVKLVCVGRIKHKG